MISDVYKYCKLSIRQILQKSINQGIQALFHLTKYSHIPIDSIIISNEGKPQSILQNQIENNVIDHLSTLKEQNTIMRHIKQVSSSKSIRNWQTICSKMPKNIYIFVRRTLIFSLPNNSNLKRWNKITSASCDLCSSKSQTRLHMLSNCPVAAAEGRYTWSLAT